MANLTLELVALSGLKFSGEIQRVDIPTPDGIIGIYPGHMPLVSLASPGVLVIRQSGAASDSLEYFAVNGGVVEITEHRVRILVNEADDPQSVVQEEAQAALERAQELEKQADNQVSLDHARQLIQTQQARLRLAELRRHRR